MKRGLSEWIAVVGMSLLVLVGALIVFFSIMQNYLDVNSPLGAYSDKKVYILDSRNTKDRLEKIGGDVENYQNNIKNIKSLLEKRSFNVSVIDENSLNTLSKNDLLLVIDALSISEYGKNIIDSFVKNGGKLLFNFNSGFTDSKGKFTDTSFIEKITSLKKEGYMAKNEENTLFIVSKLMSPVGIPHSKRLEVILYDQIPIFSGKDPHVQFVNWAMNEPLHSPSKNMNSGVVWSGRYGKGSWVYFSFPFYAFNAIEVHKSDYTSLFNSMVDYLFYGFKEVKYPYINSDKMVFISEDTEYKFENLKPFVDLVNYYDFNATVFCVGNLAEQNISLMREVGEMKNIEIGSHSYSHTEILGVPEDKLLVEIKLNKSLLEKLTKREVFGFRPPREEVDKNVEKALEDSKFSYLMAHNIGQLDAKFEDGLVTIPRIAVDDYGYLIQLDWDKEKIVNKIKEEINFLTNLNAIYTLSVHTHLMTYKSNITMVDEIFKFIKENSLPVLKGKDLVNLIKQRKNIELEVKRAELNFLVRIRNGNFDDVNNFTFRLYTNRGFDIFEASPEFTGLNVKLIKYKDKDYVDVVVDKLKRQTVVNIFLKYR
jgi:peptidoglycan/xylan/chitin deacetylase (PgdA/CDA1 family)